MPSLYLEYFKPSKEMRAGESYVCVFFVKRHYSASEERIKLPGLELYLQIEGIDSSWIDKELIRQLEPGDISFNITPPVDSGVSSFRLRVKITRGRLGPTYQDVYEETIKIANSGEASEDFNKTASVVLNFPDYTLNDSSGILYVNYDGERLRLSPYSQQFPLTSHVSLQLKSSGNINLDAIIDKNYSFNDLCLIGRKLFQEFDRQIIKWIYSLLKTDAPASLLIFDNTMFEIPWELIYFESEGEGNYQSGFLGSIAAISRWKPMPGTSADKDRIPEMRDSIRSGKLISCILDYSLPGAKIEGDAVKKCGADYLTSIDEMASTLDKSDSDVVLIHLASHATFEDDDPLKTVIGSPAEILSALQAEKFSSSSMVNNSKPVIFINACHSARRGQILWAVYGFGVPFLNGGAKGVLGVMGRVHSKSAANIAARLFDEMLSENPASIAEMLRKIREESAREARQNSAAQKFFLDSLMYVYYGSPFEKIRIKNKITVED